MTDITHLARALAIRSISSGGDEHMNGAALAVLRADAMIGAHDDHPATRAAQTAHDRIMGVTVADMPADPDMVGVLLETLSQRLGGVSRADCWRRIGVNPNRGRDLLTRNARALDWSIFFTLRSAALAPERRDADSAEIAGVTIPAMVTIFLDRADPAAAEIRAAEAIHDTMATLDGPDATRVRICADGARQYSLMDRPAPA